MTLILAHDQIGHLADRRGDSRIASGMLDANVAESRPEVLQLGCESAQSFLVARAVCADRCDDTIRELFPDLELTKPYDTLEYVLLEHRDECIGIITGLVDRFKYSYSFLDTVFGSVWLLSHRERDMYERVRLYRSQAVAAVCPANSVG